MPIFSQSDDLLGAEFTDVNLRGARFVGCDLTDAVMRGVDVARMEIDAPWLFEDGGAALVVNGVDVTGYVDTELDRRFPGRAERMAADPEGLRAAWASLESAWTAAIDRAAAMPAGSVEMSVDGEWSFAQTLRHLVHATDVWLGMGVLGLEQPFHPLGLTDQTAEEEGLGASVHVTTTPSFDEVLAARADRAAMVSEFLASISAEELAVVRKNPHNPEHPETTLSCVHVILQEGWEHLRFAVRDLDTLTASPSA